MKADLNDSVQALIEGSGYNEAGYAERYDEFRPQAPAVIVDILTQLSGRYAARRQDADNTGQYQ